MYDDVQNILREKHVSKYMYRDISGRALEYRINSKIMQIVAILPSLLQQ